MLSLLGYHLISTRSDKPFIITWVCLDSAGNNDAGVDNDDNGKHVYDDEDYSSANPLWKSAYFVLKLLKNLHGQIFPKKKASDTY